MKSEAGFTPLKFFKNFLGAKQNNQKTLTGFTLIELLVVIAIIGVLSTIVLVSINNSRNKGYDVAVKNALAQAKNIAELMNTDSASYVNFCVNGTHLLKTSGSGYDTQQATAHNSIIANNDGSNEICYSDAGTYCIQSALKGGGSYCKDSTGYSGIAAYCDATNYNCANP